MLRPWGPLAKGRSPRRIQGGGHRAMEVAGLGTGEFQPEGANWKHMCLDRHRNPQSCFSIP